MMHEAAAGPMTTMWSVAAAAAVIAIFALPTPRLVETGAAALVTTAAPQLCYWVHEEPEFLHREL